jgi:hypothetical protein
MEVVMHSAHHKQAVEKARRGGWAIVRIQAALFTTGHNPTGLYRQFLAG